MARGGHLDAPSAARAPLLGRDDGRRSVAVGHGRRRAITGELSWWRANKLSWSRNGTVVGVPAYGRWPMMSPEAVSGRYARPA
eukprot:3852588-Prymnesium_polylepis.1